MNLPSLAWTNVSFQVKEWSGWKGIKKKPILQQLTGSFSVGTLNGLLGPSGAGKTTLLNVLSGTNTSGLTVDSVIYTKEKNPTSYFIAQHVHESIVGELTVGQILHYAYKFKNGSGSSSEEVNNLIGNVLQNLLLDHSILDRPFGICSGGEQKRVAIAQELMAKQAPTFLFLDEPTTGLDSAAAYEVMSSLQALARSQCITVIASIHAPNHETLHLFDQLYVLAKGGLAIYSGPPTSIRSYLQTELCLKMSDQQPPIEVLLKIACTGSANAAVPKLATQVLSTEMSSLKPSLPSLNLQLNSLPTPRKFFSLSNFITQLSRQLQITFVAQLRTFLFTPLLFLAFFGVLSTIFSSKKASGTGCYSLVLSNATRSCPSNEKSLTQENVYYLSFVIQIIGLCYMATSTVLYSTYIQIFKAEHRNRWYSLGVFYWSLGITSLLELCAISAILSCVTYFLSFQHAADNYSINWTRLGLYAFFIWLLCFFYQSFGQFIGILVGSPMMAFLVCQFATGAFSFFNGLYVKVERMESPILEQMNDWLGVVYTTRGIIYAIYGVDRCEVGKEYSWVLLDYGVDMEKIGEYAWRVLLNILILRGISLLVMLLKFNSLNIGKRNFITVNAEKRIEHFKIDFEKASKVKKMQVIDIQMKNLNVYDLKIKEYSPNKILIGWRNLSLFTSSSVFEMGKKQMGEPILRNLNGEFKFGTLNALMGTSGAGKTSLLKVLNGRCKTRLSEETQMYLSNLTPIKTCFITQEVSGHLMPGLTAKQMLIYASKLKNVQSGVDHEAIAMKWLQELDLLNTTNTKVEKCSGGERKRLAVALELTALEMPNCVCIDEPTSGLDTNSAEIVISTLRNLAHSHSLTIITSIHQPTAEILFMFDQLYVLARGGVAIYSGPPTGIQSHLNQISQPSPTGSQFSIEILIKHSCSSHIHPTVQQLVMLTNKQFISEPPNLQLLSQATLTTDGILPNRSRFSFYSTTILSCRFLLYLRGYLWKLWLFMAINLLGYALCLRFFFNPSKFIYVSGCISPEDDLSCSSKTAQAIEDELSLSDNLQYVNFFTNIYLLMVVFLSSINFYFEFPYFLNEHRNGWYSTGSYYLMKSLFEVLPLVLVNFAYIAIINIYSPVLGHLYWPLFTLLSLAAIGYIGLAHCCCLLLPKNRMGQTILLLGIYLLFVILSNCFLPLSSVHYVYQFLANFNISRFTLENVLLLQYGFGRCRQKEIQGVLHLMSITDDDYMKNILMLLFNLIFYRLIAVFLLIRTVNPIRNRRKRVNRIVQYQDKIQNRVAKAIFY